MNERKRLALVGGGLLGRIIAKAAADGLLPDYDLVGVYSRTPASAAETAALAGCRACASLEELLDLAPDFVAEAASVQALRDLALPVLSRGIQLVVLSAGAFADDAFYEQVRACAAAGGGRVHVASGAIGGFDVLQTITLMAQAAGQEETAAVHARKRPASLQNSPLYHEGLLQAETEAFSGTAREAIALLPTQVNVTVAAALTTTGPAQTAVRITTIPGFQGDDHRITAEACGVRAELDIYSASSTVAGWSVVTLLRNLAAPISFH